MLHPNLLYAAAQLVILDKDTAHAATADILAQHCIAHDRWVVSWSGLRPRGVVGN